MGLFSLLLQRERGLKPICGNEDSVYSSIYSSFEPYSCWNSHSDGGTEYGGVYNLEFSPDG